jgi:large subunit ribosomal protein L19
MKVGVSDKYAVGKINEFVGICIQRDGNGLRASFILRNVVDNQGNNKKSGLQCAFPLMTF